MKIYCKIKHWKINEEYDIDKILYLLIDRPNYINSSNSFVWKNNKNQYHRDYDLPDYINNNGLISWSKNNKLHRDNNKPARILVNGLKEYYINDKFVK